MDIKQKKQLADIKQKKEVADIKDSVNLIRYIPSTLPKKARNKIKSLLRGIRSKSLKEISSNFRGANWSRLEKLMSRKPNMKSAHKKALDMFSDMQAWADYTTKLMESVYHKMLASGDATLVQTARDGFMSRDVFINVLRERFRNRGLEISEIPKKLGALENDVFQAYLAKGPIWDRPMAGSYHGEYSHLLQIDYAIDAMLSASDGKVKNAQEFFDFWGDSEDGLEVWNVIFDIVKEGLLSRPDYVTSTVEAKLPFKD